MNVWNDPWTWFAVAAVLAAVLVWDAIRARRDRR